MESAEHVKFKQFGKEHGEVAGHMKTPTFPNDWFKDDELPIYIWSLDRTATVEGEESVALAHQLWGALDSFRPSGSSVAVALLKAAKHVTPLRGTNSATGEKTNDADGAPSRDHVVEKYPHRSTLISKHRSGGAHGSHQGLLETMLQKWIDPLCKGTPPRSRIGVHPLFFELPDRSGVVSCVDAYMQISGGNGKGKELKAVWSQELSNAVPRFGMQVGGGELCRRLESQSAAAGASTLPSFGQCGNPGCRSNKLCSGCEKAAAASKVSAANASAVGVLHTMTAARSASAFVLNELNRQRPDLKTSADAANFTGERFVKLLMENDTTECSAPALRRTRKPRFNPQELVLAQYQGSKDKESSGGWREDDDDDDDEFVYYPAKVVNCTFQSTSGMLDVGW